MANTKIPIELSSTPSIVDNGDATAITIDSSENVGLGARLSVGTTTVGGGNTKIVATGGTDNYIQLVSNTGNGGVSLGNAGGPNLLFYTHTGALGSESFSERMRITSTGRLGLGTTNPESQVEIVSTSSDVGTLTLRNTAGASGYTGIGFSSNVTAGREKAAIYFQETHGTAHYTGNLVFATNNVSGGATRVSTSDERMRITSAGNVLLGDGLAEVITYTSANKLIMSHGHAFGNIGISLSCGAYTSNYELMRFYNGNGQVGDIMVGGSATDFDTNSDYRLKENVSYDWDATTRLKQLKPARFNWIADETNTLLDGFLAHEVSDIVPNAVNGEKDAVYTAQDEANGLGKEGEPNMQGIDHSKLVPLLTKAIQEQQTIIEDLKARIETLEGS